jgi:hypothetical protein
MRRIKDEEVTDIEVQLIEPGASRGQYPGDESPLSIPPSLSGFAEQTGR